LIIAWEEGEIEYEDSLLKKANAVVEWIEEEEDFNTNHLVELEKKHKPDRIIIEYNGMWNCKNIKKFRSPCGFRNFSFSSLEDYFTSSKK
jgi:hypothetical protein